MTVSEPAPPPSPPTEADEAAAPAETAEAASSAETAEAAAPAETAEAVAETVEAAELAETAEAAEPSALTVEGEMTVYRAVELKEAMLGALRRPGPVEVDLSGVTELDSAGVQVLLLGKQLAGARQQELRLTAISPAVDEVLALLNLRRHLGLVPAETAAPAPAPHAKATDS